MSSENATYYYVFKQKRPACSTECYTHVVSHRRCSCILQQTAGAPVK